MRDMTIRVALLAAVFTGAAWGCDGEAPDGDGDGDVDVGADSDGDVDVDADGDGDVGCEERCFESPACDACWEDDGETSELCDPCADALHTCFLESTCDCYPSAVEGECVSACGGLESCRTFCYSAVEYYLLECGYD